MITKHRKKYRALHMAYACLPPCDEYNTLSYVERSPGMTAKHDIAKLRSVKVKTFAIAGDNVRKNQSVLKNFHPKNVPSQL
jgi:hypothetical protein